MPTPLPDVCSLVIELLRLEWTVLVQQLVSSLPLPLPHPQPLPLSLPVLPRHYHCRC